MIKMMNLLRSKVLQNKKGQFYILIALLLVSYAFTLTRQEVPVRRLKETFQLLHEGYISEGTAAINNAVYEEVNVTARFASFTTDYLAFAKSADPNFRLVYLLRYRENDQTFLGYDNEQDRQLLERIIRCLTAAHDYFRRSGDSSRDRRAAHLMSEIERYMFFEGSPDILEVIDEFAESDSG